MSIGFGLLGPLRVTVDGRDLTVSAPRQREVLAALLLHANRNMRPVELSALVWSNRPPAAWRGTLQSHVMRLRRTLGPVAGARIATTPTGYLIRAAEDEVDTLSFAAQRALGAQALRRRDWDTASAHFTAALSLFRGEPLADVEELAGRTGDVARFTELRLRALGDRIDADLARGRHADVVGELRSLTREYPLREHPHAQLIDALTAVGRRADALEVFRELRARLVDELGIEPGQLAQQAHMRALANAPGRAHPPVIATGGALAPDLLAPPPADWVGRDAEVAVLTAALRGAAAGHCPPVVAITGGGGIGKTALAAHAARLCAQDFPDGRLLLSVGSACPETAPVPAGELPALLLRQLGFEQWDIPQSPAHSQRLAADVIAHRRLLIVLDDVQNAAQVLPLLPRSGRSAMLLTSRNALAELATGRTVRLTGLCPEAGLALLRRTVGAGRVEREPQAARDIVEACGGLPLALRIAGARLASRPAWTLAGFAERLREPDSRLRELRLGDVSVRAVFETGLRAVAERSGSGPAAPARLFRLLGAVDAEDLLLDAVCALADAPAQDVEDALEVLVDHHLAESPEMGVYRLPDLQHAYAAELAARCGTDFHRAAARLACRVPKLAHAQ
jgi:DNA-binding SARP family transcriptional activator